MLQNAPNCTIPKKFWGSMPPNPPSKRMATPRVASPPPKKKKTFAKFSLGSISHTR